ncbi:MAG: signal recognition particle-docking protein FtsY [Bdellovibrionota bacterium]
MDSILFLIVFCGVLVLAIAAPFILKLFNKNKTTNDKKIVQPSHQKGDEPRDFSENTAKINREALLDDSLTQEINLERLQREEQLQGSLRTALTKTEENIFGRIKNLFSSSLENPAMEDIEEVLYTSDLGPGTVQMLMDGLNRDLSGSQKKDFEAIKSSLKKEISNIFAAVPPCEVIRWNKTGPTVIMIVGVNGAGKTTTIGKISAYWALQGKKVLVAAGDTFRAAAESQLKVWTERAQVQIFSPPRVTDPSAVAFDAISRAKSQSYDLVIIDTAGRLHTQTHLMEELKKVKRVLTKVIEDAPHEIWIVLDANSGQNALLQAKEFHQSLGLTGAILTKLDGTAKGGVVVGLTQELQVPIKWVGIGEKIGDLKSFSSQEFIDSLFTR